MEPLSAEGGGFLENLFAGFAPASEVEDVSICVIGGGVSGLAASITAAEQLNNGDNDKKIVLLEKSSTLGGRVQSDATDDGYTLDRGFAVFIEEYPCSKKLLDYDQLKLGRFVPGSLVKIAGQDGLCKVADPLRVPSDLLTAILAPVGSLVDKALVLTLLFTVFTNSVDDLFAMEETDTLTCLKQRYRFSDAFISQFFKPFLEGIYLAPLEEQSSRMFHFVFKMFAEGSATLPEGGMGKVTDLLASNAKAANVDIRNNSALSSLSIDKDGHIVVQSKDKSRFRAKSVIIATDGAVAQTILSTIPGLESLKDSPTQEQRSVGCFYYGFDTPVPVQDPILILNGAERDSPLTHPVNNVCFPSVVNKGYAPTDCHLCSVTLLKKTLDAFGDDKDKLDQAIRAQLQTWFPDCAQDIAESWQFKGMYKFDNAQPAQLTGPAPANVNGGRDCATYRGNTLPMGLFVCGDHMSTATLNGALESGVNAGTEAAKVV